MRIQKHEFLFDGVNHIFEYYPEKKILYFTAESNGKTILPVLAGKQILRDGKVWYKFPEMDFKFNKEDYDNTMVRGGGCDYDPWSFNVDLDMVDNTVFERPFEPIRSIESIEFLDDLLEVSSSIRLLVNGELFILPVVIEQEEVVNGFPHYEMHPEYSLLLAVYIFNRPVIEVPKALLEKKYIGTLADKYGYLSKIYGRFYAYRQ